MGLDEMGINHHVEGQVDKNSWYRVNVTFQIHWLALGKTVQNSITLDVNVKRI